MLRFGEETFERQAARAGPAERVRILLEPAPATFVADIEEIVRIVDRLACRRNALVHPRALSWGWVMNLIWPSRYQAAVRRLQDEPVEFKPQDGVEAVLGKKRSWQEELYGDLAAYEPFKKTFTEVIAAFNERSSLAAADLARLEAAVTGHGPALDAVAASLAAV